MTLLLIYLLSFAFCVGFFWKIFRDADAESWRIILGYAILAIPVFNTLVAVFLIFVILHDVTAAAREWKRKG